MKLPSKWRIFDLNRNKPLKFDEEYENTFSLTQYYNVVYTQSRVEQLQYNWEEQLLQSFTLN